MYSTVFTCLEEHRILRTHYTRPSQNHLWTMYPMALHPLPHTPYPQLEGSTLNVSFKE